MTTERGHNIIIFVEDKMISCSWVIRTSTLIREMLSHDKFVPEILIHSPECTICKPALKTCSVIWQRRQTRFRGCRSVPGGGDNTTTKASTYSIALLIRESASVFGLFSRVRILHVIYLFIRTKMKRAKNGMVEKARQWRGAAGVFFYLFLSIAPSFFDLDKSSRIGIAKS